MLLGTFWVIIGYLFSLFIFFCQVSFVFKYFAYFKI